MKKMILMVLGVLVIALFLVACAPKVTDEELEAELAKLSPEELNTVIAEAEAGEDQAMAGLATQRVVSSQVTGVSKSRLTTAAKKVQVAKMNSLPQCSPPCEEGKYCMINTCVSAFDCIDTEREKNYFTKGVVYMVYKVGASPAFPYYNLKTGLPYMTFPGANTLVLYKLADSCGSEEPYSDFIPAYLPNEVVEHDCGNNNGWGEERYTCPNGCKDGACLPVPITATAEKLVVPTS